MTDRGQALQFGGSGFDKLGHAMVEYRWMSDKDGLLSDQANFTKTKLSYNTHAITFQVKDIEGMWSTKAKTSFTYAPNLAPKIVEPEQDVFYSDDWVATEATGEARLTFDVYAEDPEGDDITYSVGSLPNGSTFTIITDALQRKVGRFEWITTLKDFTQTVYFTAKDWQLSGSKAVYIRIR